MGISFLPKGAFTRLTWSIINAVGGVLDSTAASNSSAGTAAKPGGERESLKRMYFAYGSNMDCDQLRQRCPTARFVAIAKLDAHRFASQGNRRNAVVESRQLNPSYRMKYGALSFRLMSRKLSPSTNAKATILIVRHKPIRTIAKKSGC